KNTMYYADSNTYLDVHIRTTKQCIQHEIPRNTGFCLTNIQEWCEYCSEIAYFNQVAADLLAVNVDILENERYCKLCEKLIYQQDISHLSFVNIKLCSDCYV